ncbi:MAG: tRNA (N6-isopentenyl adenosine(37)-C2)-methylthiotransferase MiaB [Legionellales bacterium]|nr:MAG: tRNA (N6-isopentenyl adenosine(37)-C2)-methylthiotransferase MiaB [Legionellales bacterium]
MKTVFIKTHGCQMNEYDSSRMLDLLATIGYQPTQDEATANLLLLNTCSIREKAQERVFHQLGRWRKYKTKQPDTIIGVGGCVASQEGSAIRERAPYVDLIFGPQTLHRLPALLQDLHKTNKAVVDISFPEIEKFDCLPAPKAHGPSAFVSIMEGCSKFCSYCIVPFTRGAEVSRPLEDIILEIFELIKQGVIEINLLGQNVNAYRGSMADGNTADLALLIHHIAAIEQIKRIRFTTSHPAEFSDSLIEAYGTVPKLADQLHLPVQSGSDQILTAMKRGYTALEYKAKIRKLRALRPNLTISSDFIVGFPDETDADFAATMDLIDKVGFDISFSFIYSKRPGTPAAYLTDNISSAIKQQRLKILQGRVLQQAQQIGATMVNSIQDVLVTGVSKKDPNMLTGKTSNNRTVNFNGDNSMVGQMLPIKIIANKVHTLVGTTCVS